MARIQYRRFEADRDLNEVLALYRRAINHIDPELYSEAQRAAWLHWSQRHDLARERLSQGATILAHRDDRLLAFAQLNPPDLINMLYVDPAHERLGLGSSLIDVLELVAARAGVSLMRTRASDVSLALFQRKGFRTQQRESMDVGGTSIARTILYKPLPGGRQSHE